MLDSLRKHATGWVAKLLFAILILSFAIWGIGDIFLGPTGGGSLAEVAGSEVSEREVTEEFERQWRQMQEQFGPQLDRKAAVSLGVLNQAVQTAVARRLVDAHARDLDLTVADATIAERIRQDPNFQSAGGFDRGRFDLFLRSVGMSEQDYIAALRNDLVRGSLLDSLTGPIAVPTTLAKKLVEHRQEQRRGQALLVRAEAIPVESPSEETLAAYMKENEQTYAAPEYRSLSLLTLRPEDLLGEIEIGEADLRAAYDARIASYRKPEQRRIEQLLAADEATMKRAAEMVASGQSFEATAQALKDAGVERSELGPLAKGDLPTELDEPVWVLTEGGVSAPLKSAFGWHLLRVSAIEPEETQPFEAVKEELQRELALERATNELPDLATRLDDEIAAGTGLDQAAAKLGLELLKLEKIDRTGHTAAKERLAADRLTGEVLTAAFTAAEGETSLLQQTQDGGYYMFRVDAVVPARPRTLEEVRSDVEAAWKQAEQRKRAHARAEELRGQETSPAALRDLAATQKDAQAIPIGPVTREATGELEGLGPEAVAALFQTAAGQVAAKVVDVPDGTAVVATEEVLPAKVEPTLVDATEAAVLASLRNELIAGYEAALRQRYPVSIDQDALARLMEAQAGQ